MASPSTVSKFEPRERGGYANSGANAPSRAAPRTGTADALAAALGPHGGLIIWGGFASAVLGFLGFALVTSARGERAQALVVAAERALLAHAGVRRELGPVLAGGAYSITSSRAAAHGSFAARALNGRRARVHVAALAAPGGGWALTDLRVELADDGDAAPAATLHVLRDGADELR